MIIRKSSSFIPGFKRGLHNNFRLLKASLSYGCHNPKMVLLIPFMLSLVDRAVLRYAISQKKSFLQHAVNEMVPLHASF